MEPHKYGYLCSDGLAQDCSNSIANALELLQSCMWYMGGINHSGAILIFVGVDFLAWLLIGWRLWCQAIEARFENAR